MTRYKPIILVALAIFLVLAIVSVLVITSPNRTSTTPELIQRAFDRGEITAEQRLLYLTYAIYEYESLPARFRGEVPWEATMSLLSEMDVAMHSPTPFCSMSPFVQSEIRRLLKPDTICD